MKKYSIILSFIIIFLLLILFKYFLVVTAKVDVKLIDDLTIEFNDNKKISDFITYINGNIIDDRKINSKVLGTQKISFVFKNEQHIRVKYSFNIDVIDTVKPYIGVSGTYSVKRGSKDNLLDSIMCADNFDDNPKCFIEGNYDLSTVGKYPLIFRAIDNSGNESVRKFTLNVYEFSSSGNNSSSKPQYLDFKDVIAQYKTENTKIGIDVSKWQGVIDYQKIKDSGVEFVMIKIGSSSGKNKSIILDPKFLENIENAKKVGLPVGVYFYSYADSIHQAEKEARWVVEKLKKYSIDLPVVFDWEEWGNFNQYHFSFYKLTQVANAFLKIIEDNGYEGMLYSSKYYLENIWFPVDYKIWLAHYTRKTDYQKDYYMWQLSNVGKVEGIDTAVDINVLYR